MAFGIKTSSALMSQPFNYAGVGVSTEEEAGYFDKVLKINSGDIDEKVRFFNSVFLNNNVWFKGPCTYKFSANYVQIYGQIGQY